MKCFNIFPLLILLSSCSGFSLDKNSIERIFVFDEYEKIDSTPKDAILFQCANNESFYIKYLEENNAVWVILKDREFRLDKIEGENQTFTNTSTTLNIQNNKTTLKVDDSSLYKECQNIDQEDIVKNNNNIKKKTPKVSDQDDASNNVDPIQNDDKGNGQNMIHDDVEESSWLEKLKFWKKNQIL